MHFLFLSKHRTFLTWVGACCLLGGWLLGAEQAHATNCMKLFRAKKYIPAAECFEQDAKNMGPSAKLATMKQYAKGRSIRNAATAYLKAAEKAKNELGAVRWKRLALKMLEWVLKDELYESAQQEQELRKQRKELLDEIGLATLEVSTADKKAKICLSDSKGNKKCKEGAKWRREWKAGSYTLEVTYPGGKSVTRKIELKANATMSQSFSPPQSSTKLVVKTQHPGAKLVLSGPPLKGKKLRFVGEVWNTKVQPGTYVLGVTYPGMPEIRRTLQVNVGETKILALAPPSSTLIITSEPPGAEVLIDDQSRGVTPLKILVLEGKRKVVLRKGCHFPNTQEVSIQPQESKKLNVPLAAEPVYADWLRQKDGRKTKKTLGWVGLIAGVAVIGLASSSYVAAGLSHEDAAKQKELYLTTRQQPEQYISSFQSAAQAGNTWRTVGHVGMGLGAVGLGFGLFQFLGANLQPAHTLDCRVPIRKQK